jgi:23S rRNA pseudouridine2605 synthase
VTPNDPVRLQLYMARCGVASRRRSEALILDGTVTVNGSIVTRLGTKVSEEDDVRVAGRKIRPEGRKIYVALNKPRQYLCSASDPEGRPLAIELLTEDYPERLFSVGRLDFLSSGLIFYTNDGEFARSVSHPSSRIEKEYRVESKKPIPEDLLKEYQHGIVVENERYVLQSYRYKTPRSVRLVLVEGKNREIRRVFAHWRIGLKKIHRTRIGNVFLAELPPGSHRPLSVKEIDSLVRVARSGSHRPGSGS